jgi:hypothetical protein
MEIREDSFRPSQDAGLTPIDENWGCAGLSLRLTLKQGVCYSSFENMF